MKKITLIGLCIVFGLLFSACKKYLDVKSNSKLVIPKTLSDLQGLLDDAALMNLGTTPGYSEAMADDYFWLTATYNGRTLREQEMYQWIPTEMRYANDWSSGYLAIYNTNLCLELLDKIPLTKNNETAWNNVKGSALFFRAYYFLLLLGQYGLAYDEAHSASDPGIVLRNTSDFNQPSARSSVKQCYERINADLIQALGDLPAHALHVMRPSKGAAYALLSRSHLYMHQYDQALKYASESLKLNSELMDYNTDPSMISLTANVPFKKYNKEILFYTEMGTYTALHVPVRAKIDTVLYASYAANDLRKACFFKSNAGYQQFKGSYAAHANTLFSGLATDEVYLTRAESNAFLGNLEAAMTDLNTLLKSRWKNSVPYVPFNAVNRLDALQRIRLERRKELLMRNLRWMDVKRLNKEGEEIVMIRTINGKEVSLLPNARFYALPIPIDIIELTGMPQN